MILSKSNGFKIFVTTGSSLEFDLLSKKMDYINKNKDYDVVIQTGKGKYIPKNCKSFDFDKNLDKYYNWADLVITHTGAGTLFELLEKNKKIISVTNPKAINNHELPIGLEKKGYIKYLSKNNINLLKKYVVDIKNNKIKFNKYKLEKNTIAKEILDYIYK